MIEINKIYNEDCLETLKDFNDKSVDCVITSPPYWQLRDYGFNGQWGLEPTYQEYLEHLWSLMDEIWRVLKDTGTVWINLGDSYGGSGKKQPWHKDDAGFQGNNRDIQGRAGTGNNETSKCLMLIPHRFAIGCIDRGWILRNDIIWAKRNGMPESVTDRFSKKHEYFFLLVKQQKYYFDLDGIRDKHTNLADLRRRIDSGRGNYSSPNSDNYGADFNKRSRTEMFNESGKNPGDVSDFWDIPTQPSSAKHYATFNTDLIDKPIVAGCPEGGIILDPFCGTGTTLIRGLQLNRQVIGIDGKKEYCDIAQKRINQELAQLKLAL